MRPPFESVRSGSPNLRLHPSLQGYKFNVFYPDLLEKNEAPTFSCEPDPSGDGTTCLLRFHAGPPYEDIAFRWGGHHVPPRAPRTGSKADACVCAKILVPLPKSCNVCNQ